MAKTRSKFTADEIIRPIAATCAKCKGAAVIYPIDPDGGSNAVTFCSSCSPAWSQSFFSFLTDQYRESLGLTRLGENWQPA